MKIFLSLITFIFSITAHASDFCNTINDNIYKDEIYLMPPGQIYSVTGPEKLYIYKAPNAKCTSEEKLFLIKNDKVHAYTEYREFFSIMYLRNNGEAIEGWVLKEKLSKTNERVSP